MSIDHVTETNNGTSDLLSDPRDPGPWGLCRGTFGVVEVNWQVLTEERSSVIWWGCGIKQVGWLQYACDMVTLKCLHAYLRLRYGARRAHLKTTHFTLRSKEKHSFSLHLGRFMCSHQTFLNRSFLKEKCKPHRFREFRENRELQLSRVKTSSHKWEEHRTVGIWMHNQTHLYDFDMWLLFMKEHVPWHCHIEWWLRIKIFRRIT